MPGSAAVSDSSIAAAIWMSNNVGEYLALDRPHRLVFSFAVPRFSAGATRVTLEITAQATGCELTLTHEGVLPDYAERTRQGWDMILGALEKELA